MFDHKGGEHCSEGGRWKQVEKTQGGCIGCAAKLKPHPAHKQM